MDRLRDRPMFKWRCVTTLMCLTLFLGVWGVLGFHEATEPEETIFIACMAVVWCICDAVDTMIAALRSHALKDD